jgi:hypothetical protein
MKNIKLIALYALFFWTSGPLWAQVPARGYYYDLKEGVDYGYTALQQPGQAGRSIIMVSYAGQRDGKYQVHTRQATLVSAFECSAPCDVIKVMSVIDADGLRRTVNVERIRAAPNMIGAMALADAMAGRLESYVEYIDNTPKGRQAEVWVDEQKGLTRTVLKKSKK